MMIQIFWPLVFERDGSSLFFVFGLIRIFVLFSVFVYWFGFVVLVVCLIFLFIIVLTFFGLDHRG